jgi:hypothetical protein
MPTFLEELDLSGEIVGRRIEFLAQRGELHREEAQSHEREDWRRNALWGAAGSCAIQSAELALIAGNDARSYIAQAGSDFSRAGLPFGLLLQVLAASEDDARGIVFNSRAGDWIWQIDAAEKESAGDHEPDRHFEQTAPALAVKNQQIYLCLAMVSVPDAAREYGEPLSRIIEGLGLHPNLPHGAQGQPLQVYLDIIEPAFTIARSQKFGEISSRQMRALFRLAVRYSESIEAARRNTYLWKNLWSPVEYVDLDVVTAAFSLARATKNREFLYADMHDLVANIPFQVALELTGTQESKRPTPPSRTRPRRRFRG